MKGNARPTISPLTPDELAWLESHVDLCRGFVCSYLRRPMRSGGEGGADADGGGGGWDPADLESLDASLRAWRDDPAQVKPAAGDVCHVCGVIVGRIVAGETGARWGVCEAGGVSALVLHHPERDAVAMPAHLVAERVRRGGDEEDGGGKGLLTRLREELGRLFAGDGA